MKRMLALACAAALAFTGAASAQRYGDQRGPDNRGYQGPPQGQRGFAAENESENNSMSYLLSHGYQIVAGWEGTLVLQRAERVYLCSYSRYRTGNDRSGGQVMSGMCQHIREGVQF